MNDQQRPRILFTTTDLPYPLDSGGRIKTFRFLEHLTKAADVKMICAYGGKRKKDAFALRERLKLSGFQAFQDHKSRSPLHILKAFLFAPTLNAYRVENKELTSMITWSSRDCDLVIVDHLEAYHLLPDEFGTPVIYHSHNAEFKLWSEFAKRSSGLKKLMLQWEAGRVKRFEKWAISRSRFSFVAPNDQVAIQSTIGFKDEAFRPTYHLGNDELLGLPEIDLTSNNKQLFYAGTLDWEPNRDGLEWFLREVWPKTIKKHPDSSLQVCGRNADGALVSLMGRSQGVKYLGFVEDLEPIMSKSKAAVVPLRFGSGMKIKSFDAVYRGLPLITTPTGIEGTKFENNVHVYLVDSSDQFAEAIDSVFSHVQEAITISKNGRALCREEYTNDKLFNGMVSAILELGLRSSGSAT